MAQPLPWWLRAIFVLIAAQALLLVAAFFQPPLISLLVPWPASPLNARFIAAIYTALGLGVLLCSMARSFREVRIVLFGMMLVTWRYSGRQRRTGYSVSCVGASRRGSASGIGKTGISRAPGVKLT